MGLPSIRKLRGYAFDPSLSNQIDTFQINEIIYEIPWEEINYENGVLEGEYIEIVDYDPTVDEFYEVVDLDDKFVLANDGLNPSESNPQFHQQMVYAVVMTTIKNFEHALGRKILWSRRRLEYDKSKGKDVYEEYIDKLRIYPHAMREANAYYSPQKKALLFGYFHSNPTDQALQMPGSLVFTCLSHDIIAHETTHAILDGMQKYYNEPRNPDVLAFHEAFADIVALFQHFSFPEVLKHQIAKTRGRLDQQNILGELAQQFGVAVGNYGGLRDAIGGYDDKTEKKKWKPKKPNPRDYANILEPHARGSILVAAVFEAFLSVYKRRVEDLYRIASNGTGILPEGDLHPDLVNRLAKEAAKTSKHILNICIRAVDYCPPVDITFGDYLRAIVTADYDATKKDPYAYRLAFIEAFKRRGIYPTGIASLSVESLRHRFAPISDPNVDNNGYNQTIMGILAKFLRDYAHEIAYITNRRKIYEITSAVVSGRGIQKLERISDKISLHQRIGAKFRGSRHFMNMTGLVFDGNKEEFGIRTSLRRPNNPSFQVHNLRLVSRVGPDGDMINQVVFSVVQRCGAKMKDGKYVDGFTPPYGDEFIPQRYEGNGFQFRGGCTFIMDLDSGELKYLISKPIFIEDKNGRTVLNIPAIEKQWEYIRNTDIHNANEFQRYFGRGISNFGLEPFAMLHQH